MNEETPPAQGHPLLALGFRPFFLLGALGAVGLVTTWLARLYGIGLAGGAAGATWHGHEMLAGYATAVIAGFLLTATRNWTGQETARGGLLGGVALLWLGGRLAAFLDGVVWSTLTDGGLLVVLALLTGRPILQAGQRHNYVFPLLLLLMALADGWYHAGGGSRALQALLWLILTLLSLIAGRVLPFFTARALPGAPERRYPGLEIACSALLAVLALGSAWGAAPILFGLVAALAAGLHTWRAALWFDARIPRVPLLWVLHLAYFWLLAGLVLAAAASAWPPLRDAATHALTTGAIGGMTLGMMARVSLGHTGRPLVPPPGITGAFALVHLAALVRVLAGLGIGTRWLLGGAGALWVAAFGLFLWRYAPMLVRPRADGRPG